MKPEILFLAHRIPYPPNRGDKMRSWNMLRHIGRHARVHLGAFADDDAEAAWLGPLREAMGGALGEAYIEPRHRKRAWAMRALLRGQPAALAAFHGTGMLAFARHILSRPQVAAILASSIQMAQFVPAESGRRFVMDFVDFDSAKFAEYAAQCRSPRWLMLKREALLLRSYEREVAARADISLFVSEAETRLFRGEARPEHADVRALPNGIDLDYYDPRATFALLDPPPPTGSLIVFTGQMNYHPNVQGVRAFARDVMPLVQKARPDARFAIVGRRPVRRVREIDGKDGAIVTGEVADVRPWLAAASVVVAPLEIARGIQNKVLEAMAMGRPVVASTPAFVGIDAEPGRHLLVADGARAQADAVLMLLDDHERARRMGQAARSCMAEHHAWDARLAPLAGMLGLEA